MGEQILSSSNVNLDNRQKWVGSSTPRLLQLWEKTPGQSPTAGWSEMGKRKCVLLPETERQTSSPHQIPVVIEPPQFITRR
jgi:hypothetical protein